MTDTPIASMVAMTEQFAERDRARIALGRRVAEMMQAREDGDHELENRLAEALMDEYLVSDANGRMQPGAWMDGAFFAYEDAVAKLEAAWLDLAPEARALIAGAMGWMKP